ncbi:adenylate/guanylate cyclase domain-containing protein [Nocardioides sp.]|uniref:adenylate/guanylate cyclase domain-containing protein n=1 Tax=Nocardioides sp. TaxID=35761 RepID=UPI002B27A907|nr:adenylate/guanylate cyclase domain-containing protein [Nocardioides sp.]
MGGAEDVDGARAGDGPGAPDLVGAFDAAEASLLGAEPSLTRLQVCEQTGIDLEVATRLWHLMGFAHAADDEVAFTPADVEALRHAWDLVELGILSPDRQAALVRTWGRSFARLAEWQTSLLTSVALEDAERRGETADPAATLTALTEQVLPRVEALQTYVWRRHLVSAGGRMLAVADPAAPSLPTAVVFVDIVGYTSRSKTLTDTELVAWIEDFEGATADLVNAVGGRIIKNIGDEVLFVVDEPEDAVRVALRMAARGSDADDRYPEVRAGIAYGEVVLRLGDVFGPTVNIASRLTSLARPGTVLVDRGAHDALEVDERETREVHDTDTDTDTDTAGPTTYRFKRLRNVSVKGYSRLAAWSVRER